MFVFMICGIRSPASPPPMGRLYLIGKVLGHTQARTTEKYAHLSDDPVRAVADRAAGRIAAAMNINPGPGAEVVPLPRKR